MLAKLGQTFDSKNTEKAHLSNKSSPGVADAINLHLLQGFWVVCDSPGVRFGLVQVSSKLTSLCCGLPVGAGRFMKSISYILDGGCRCMLRYTWREIANVMDSANRALTCILTGRHGDRALKHVHSVLWQQSNDASKRTSCICADYSSEPNRLRRCSGTRKGG
jgi:hypothetical protein